MSLVPGPPAPAHGGAVVTGASRGIGRAVAIALARRGLRVVLMARTRLDLDETARQVADAGGDAAPVACDVSDARQVTDACTEAVRILGGGPRVIVNNAGMVHRALAHETSETDWDAVLGVNLKGAFLVTRALLPSMLTTGRGRIVNVGSVSGTLGTARQCAYNAAKWGLVGFTKSLAEELRRTGLQTMVVLPGAVDTDMLRGSGFSPQMSAADVSGALVYAALDAPDAMNGSAIEIFGP